MLFIEKAIPIDEIDNIAGIIIKFWGNIPNIEKRNPCKPYSFTKNPTVKPMAKPLNITVTGIIGIPIMTSPVI